MEAFRLALRLGATGLESDVWLTADGVAVLDHDGIARSSFRKRPIGTVARAALPSHVPTLEELAAEVPAGIHVSLDLKGPGVGPIVIDVVRSTNPGLLPHLWLCHDWRSAAELRPLDRDVKLVDSTRLERIKEGPERRAASLREAGVDAIAAEASPPSPGWPPPSP